LIYKLEGNIKIEAPKVVEAIQNKPSGETNPSDKKTEKKKKEKSEKKPQAPMEEANVDVGR